MFLDTAELFALTGRRQKARQVDQLRRMGVPFWVNASGHPVVTRAALEGGSSNPQSAPTWEPAWAENRPRIAICRPR